ncbi:DUF11 domain-containing protein [Candidatus Peregrinibacteria bacterium]|nr:DUF11 domain-containing protein [Candidatus Peregrinibacteria bacterium]
MQLKNGFIQRRIVTPFILFVLLFTQILPFPVAHALSFNFSETASAQSRDLNEVYDLVTLVVDTDLESDSTNYAGFRALYPSLNADTLSDRVIRYAEDISENYDYTDTKILFYNSNTDTPQDLASALENLYLNGEGSRNNRLSGVVLIGDIPLPVVNKNGNTFVSLFPYTDFRDKAYIYNSETISFEQNPSNVLPLPEIWHGIMRAPSNTTEGRNELAEFFDKNHLYYQGEEEFTESDKRIFFGDLKTEEESMNSDIYSRYLDYLNAAEDLAYFRYNKYWAKQLNADTVSDLDIDPPTPEGASVLESIQSDDFLGNVPDIYTKQMIDNALLPYYSVFTKYLSNLNDWTENTGRYSLSEADNVPALISMKDEYARYYLKEVNNAIEAATNDIVDRIQQPLPILEYSELSGSFGNGTQFNKSVSLDSTLPFVPSTLGATVNKILFRFNYYNEVSDKLYIKGVDADILESPKQCSTYLGSTKDEYFDADGNYNPLAISQGLYSVLTNSVRQNDSSTAIPVHTVGVNTRLISATEAQALAGVNESGALVEANNEYGIPAFYPNPISTASNKYNNVMADRLQEGDLIVSVNGNEIGALLSFDQAIEKAYKDAVTLLSAADDKDSDTMNSFPYEYIHYAPKGLMGGKPKVIAGNVGIEFYRNGVKQETNFEFSVNRDGLTTDQDPQGSPEIYILFSRVGFPATFNFNNYDFDRDTEGAMFTLYDTRENRDDVDNFNGYNRDGYDNSAGCTVTNTQSEEDRCFEMLASMPVLDPAGSMAPVTSTDGSVDFDFPEGYAFEDIDEVYFDSCYAGLPSLDADSNQYSNYLYSLDPSTLAPFFPVYNEDIYAQKLKDIGIFIADADKATHTDEASNIDMSIDASQIILNDIGPAVSLKEFSDRYGLFDGIDNDGDGIVENDLDEANPIYGIPSSNIPQIGRKLLSYEYKFILPKELKGYSNGDFSETYNYDFDLILDVKPIPYKDTEISSKILHNEPTNHTITQQILSMSAFSLPIDNPRYVAFQTEPANPNRPGEIEKIIYPNTFDSPGFAQLEADLYSLANRIAVMPGAYKIFGENANKTDYSLTEISEEIASEYLLPVVRGQADMKAANGSLKTATTEKIIDAISWNSSNIDEKHEYVLKHFLNSEEDAFINESNGYEAAYLVFNGNDDYFDLNFNKDIPEESGNAFDPLTIVSEEAVDGEAVDGDAVDGDEPDSQEDSGVSYVGSQEYEFVWLDQFMAEAGEFVDGFTTIPEFENSCGYVDLQSGDNAAIETPDEVLLNQTVGSLSLSADKTFVSTGGSEILVRVESFDENQSPIADSGGELIELKIDSGADTLQFIDSSSKALIDGTTTFELISTENSGEATLYAENLEGVKSNSITISTSDNFGQIRTFSYYVADDFTEEFEEINEIFGFDEDEAEDVSSEESGAEADDMTDEEIIEEVFDTAVDEGLFDEGDEGEGAGLGDAGEGEGEGEDDSAKDITELILIQDLSDVDEVTVDILDDLLLYGVNGYRVLTDEELDLALNSGLAFSVETGVEASDSGDAEDRVNQNIYTYDGAGNVVLLTSRRVSEEELIEIEEETKEKILRDKEEELEEIIESEDEQGAEDAEEAEDGASTDDASSSWQDYYLNKEYYNKYLESSDMMSNGNRMYAEIMSDRMLALIPDSENPFIDAETNPDSIYVIEETDEIIADGESLMKISLQLFDENGNPDQRDGLQVRFSVSDPSKAQYVIFENGNIAETQDGEAVVYIRAGTKATNVTINAEVIGGGYPIISQEIYLMPGEPAEIEIEADSTVLVANNQSKTTLSFTMKDQYGNIAENSFNQLAIFLDEGVHASPSADINTSLLGTQIGTFNGKADLEIFAEDKEASINIFAVVLDYELERKMNEVGSDTHLIDFTEFTRSSIKIDIIDEEDLTLKLTNLDGRIRSELLYKGARLTNYSGPIEFISEDDNLLRFIDSQGRQVKSLEKNMNEGYLSESNARTAPVNRAGEARVTVRVPGFINEMIFINIPPGEASQIELSASDSIIYSDSEVSIEAVLKDEFGNTVSTDDSSIILFDPSSATEDLVEFTSAQSVKVNDGKSVIALKGTGLSGKLNLTASSDNIPDATISLDIKKRMNSEDVEEISPSALYVSLLGGAFGNTLIENNLAQSFLNNGKAQAVSSFSAYDTGSKILMNMDGHGVINYLADELSIEVSSFGDFPMLNIKNGNTGDNVADIVISLDYGNLTLLEDDDEIEDGGIYVKKVSDTDSSISARKQGDEIIFEKNEENLFVVSDKGLITLNDSSLELDVIREDDNIFYNDFSLVVRDRGEILALITFKAEESDLGVDNGFIVVNESGNYDIVPSLSRTSSNEAFGFKILDNENDIEEIHSPSIDYQSGYGFEGNNKHMLFFAAGNSVGESNKPYASEAMVIFGDPMVRLEVEGIVGLVSGLSGFTKDVGKPIFFGPEPIDYMVKLDFNNDGGEDLLLIYEDGLVRLLENELGNSKYYDKGYILKIVNKVLSASRIDFNGDGFDDLLIGTDEPCAGGEKPISLFINTNGSFERESFNPDVTGQVYEMKSTDLNLDSCEDLVTSDSASDIRMFYNQVNDGVCQGVSENFADSWNFGLNIDSTVNASESLFVNYSGMDSSNASVVMDFMLPDTDLPQDDESVQDAADFQESLFNNPNIANLTAPAQTVKKNFSFINIKESSALEMSSRMANDINGSTIEAGDTIEYTIVLRNTSSSSINDLKLSDLTPPTMTLLESSVKCLDQVCNDNFEWLDSGMGLRSKVLSGISVPANGIRTILYQMTINEVPKINFDLGTNFDAYPAADDPYPDVLVKREVNPDGVIQYIYSLNRLLDNGITDYSNELWTVEPSDTAALSEELDIFDANASDSEIQEELQNLINQQNQDSNFDGLPDTWGNSSGATFTEAADQIANAIQSATSLLRCGGGGCFPIPYNYAFFAPDGATPGIAAFAAGTPNFPFFSFLYPSSAPSTFRLYVSPTLTGGLGTAVCAGPSVGHTSPCFAYAVPLQALGACPDIVGPINDAVAKAKESVISPDIGMATVVSDGDTSGSNSFSYSDPSVPISAAGDVNIKVPGFPSVITDWLDNQTDEIFNKLLDLPDIYFIYPDVSTLISDHAVAAGNFQEIVGVHDFLRAVNSMPLVQIEGKEIPIKIPAISEAEITKWKRQAELWLEYEQHQLDKIEQYWTCDISEERRTVCDLVTLKMSDFMLSVQKIMDRLDFIANLPRDILDWRTAESKYATQIICYLDAIINYTGGYIKRQQKVVESWIKAGEDAIRIVRNWKVLLDLSAEYQASCDECKTDRFGDLGLLLNLFVAIPEPPIIPFPKWPDIVFDVSQVRAGVRIVWPDVTFKPEPIALPDLPVITLPENMPLGIEGLEINIPGLFEGLDLPEWLLNFPDFRLPLTLPDLPPLPLPQLPDLPRPPKIPSIPNVVAELAVNLKPIFKILCLIKKGLIPIPEGSLATEIETLTQPTVQATLPFVKELGIQLPGIEYSYAKQIKVVAKLNFGINTDFVYLAAKAASMAYNTAVENVINGINNFTSYPLQQVVDNLVNYVLEEVKKAESAAIDAAQSSAETVSETVEDTNEELNDELGLYFEDHFDELNKTISQYADQMKEFEQAEDYYITATQEILDPSDPILNRSLSQIDTSLSESDFTDYPELQNLVAMRDSLIAYTQDISDQSQLLESINDYQEFTRVLVENDNHFRPVAQVYDDSSEEIETSTQEIELMPELEDEAHDYLASNIDLPGDLPSVSQDEAALAKGFYIAIDGNSENILNYTDELDKNIKIVYSDADQDNDQDIIFSMGNGVYFKENYTFSPEEEKGTFITSLTNNSVSDYALSQAVSGLISPFENHNSAQLQWNEVKGAVAYEILIKDSMYDDDDEAVRQIFALSYPLDNPLVEDFIDEDEVIVLSTPDLPRISLEIENANYFVEIYALDENSNRSLPSNVSTLSPQICADKDAPLPVISDTELELPIFKTLDLYAGNSFDISGDISSYWLTEESTGRELWSDLNLTQDSDGDGSPSNDRDNPNFKIGPYENEEDIGMKEFTLHVMDQSNNESTQKIYVNVYPPKIYLYESLAMSLEALGEVDPKLNNIPFSIIRKRYVDQVFGGSIKKVLEVEKIVTPSIGLKEKYYTDSNGGYQVSDFNLDDIIEVKDSEGNILAEIDPETGNIGALADGYSTQVVGASVPDNPTQILIVDSEGNVMAVVQLVADPSIEISVFDEINFENSSLEFNGVNVNDINIEDEFIISTFSMDHPNYPGSAVIKYVNENKQILLLDTSGNLISLDNRISFSQKNNDYLNDPLIIDIMFNSGKIAEVLVSPYPYSPSEEDDAIIFGQSNAEIVGPDDLPKNIASFPKNSDFYGLSDEMDVVDVDEALKDDVRDYYEKGIIAGRETEDGLVIDPLQKITRAEYIRTVLGMLCIVPRPEAYQPYSQQESRGGFTDLFYSEDQLSWFYPIVKEADLRGIVFGYFGEISPEGQTPFKPDDYITRAEAAKVILEVLEMLNVIDLSGIQVLAPWYLQFISVAQNLTPYLVNNEELKNYYILRPEEAVRPNTEMNRRDLIIMTQRVLNVYDCYNADSDDDGMSDYCESLYGLEDANEDFDNDGLSNAYECNNDLDPTDKDSDDGGSSDGEEIENGTNPNDSLDDNKDSDGDGISDVLETEVYLTDPLNADSDGGGVSDGDELNNFTDPLDSDDDSETGEAEADSGIFIQPGECVSCPCPATLHHKADLLPEDIVFTVISTYDEKHFFSKSEEVIINIPNE